jgi:hypothetical protein
MAHNATGLHAFSYVIHALLCTNLVNSKSDYEVKAHLVVLLERALISSAIKSTYFSAWIIVHLCRFYISIPITM